MQEQLRVLKLYLISPLFISAFKHIVSSSDWKEAVSSQSVQGTKYIHFNLKPP